jgi:cell division protein FtsN
MHVEMAKESCPLCKRQGAANRDTASTRLCEECRALIYTIMPGASSNSFAAAGQARSSGQLQLATIAQLDAPVSFDEAPRDILVALQEPQFELASFDPVADYDEVQADHIAGVEAEYFDDFEASENAARLSAQAMADPADEAIARQAQSYETEPYEVEPYEVEPYEVEPYEAEPQVFLMAEPPERAHETAAPVETRPPEGPRKLERSQPEEPARLITLTREVAPGAQEDSDLAALKSLTAYKEAETTNRAGATSDQEAIDPWDDPLPAWEYSRNEYPLYVGISERNSSHRLKSLLIPAVLIVLLIAGYFALQSRSNAPQDQQAASPEQNRAESALPGAPPQATDAAKPASDGAQQSAAAPSGATAGAGDETKNVEKNDEAPSAPANASAGTQWRHALQALASPSEDEANLFAQRLVSAGIPAYVVPADINHRGKWFRVRVGGFNTAQEAQKFISEARVRAKAAGINLKDLNVVEYEKP